MGDRAVFKSSLPENVSPRNLCDNAGSSQIKPLFMFGDNFMNITETSTVEWKEFFFQNFLQGKLAFCVDF